MAFHLLLSFRGLLELIILKWIPRILWIISMNNAGLAEHSRECHKSRNNIKVEWIHILKAQLGESHLGNATNLLMRAHIFRYNQIKRLSVRDWSLFCILLRKLRDSYWNWILYTKSCANSSVRKRESVLSRTWNSNIIRSASPVSSHTGEK